MNICFCYLLLHFFIHTLSSPKNSDKFVILCNDFQHEVRRLLMNSSDYSDFKDSLVSFMLYQNSATFKLCRRFLQLLDDYEHIYNSRIKS